MNRKFLLGAVIVAVVLAAGCVQETTGQEPKLSDFPEAFSKDTVIVVGDNASSMEAEAAEEISSFVEKKTGNKPAIKNYSELSPKDRKSNLIVLGTSGSNKMLKEVYEKTSVTEVNESYPGDNKGVLEIASNPWNKRRKILLIGGSNYEGIKSASVHVTDLPYLWKPISIEITDSINIISQTEALKKADAPENANSTLLTSISDPNYTSYVIYNKSTEKRISALEDKFDIDKNYVWKITYMKNDVSRTVLLNGKSGELIGELENVEISRGVPGIM